jgi:hypothetical protein
MSGLTALLLGMESWSWSLAREENLSGRTWAYGMDFGKGVE